MDIGWGREKLPQYFEDKKMFIDEVRSNECSFNDPEKKGTNDSERINLIFDKDLKYSVVLISDMNMSALVREGLRASVRNYSDMKLFILTTNRHPNDYKQGNNNQIIINMTDFDNLVKFCI